MNESRFHHYVPRFYLARFVDSNGGLWVFDKETGRVFRTAPDKVAGENRFYDFQELRTIGADPQLMEKQFADIEAEVSKIMGNWFDLLQSHRIVEIPPVNREIVSLFLTLQLLRTAEARILLIQFAQALEGELEKYDPEQDASGLHMQLLWHEEFVNKITKKIKDSIWIFARNDSRQPFYTSDHPALLQSFDSKQWLLGPEVFEYGMYIVFPLSPRWILYCKDRKAWGAVAKLDGLVSPVVFTIDMVNHENSGQIGRSSRFIFSNSTDFRFAQEYLKDYSEHSDPDRKRFV